MKENKQNLAGTYTISVADSNGKVLNTIIGKGSIEERKNIFLNLLSDDYFEHAEQFIKNNFVSGDNLFADDDAIFGATSRLIELVQFDAAKVVPTPEEMKDVHYTIEGTDEAGNKMVAHFSKPSKKVKQKLFTLMMKGNNNPFALGEIVLLECFLEGDDLTQDKEVFTAASYIASHYTSYSEASIKKN